MSLELIARINELGHSPNCVLKVLDNILPHCNAPEDVAERTWLGVQLSICEFDAAGISYPKSCRQFSSLMECTGLLESKSTWWTTFSGNYRYISTICSEYRSEYELENIVKLYQNVSSAMYDHHEGHDKTLREFKSRFEEAIETSNVWKAKLDSLAGELEALRCGLTNTTNLANAMPQYLVHFSNELDLLHKKSAVIHSSLYNVETVTDDLTRVLSIFYSQLSENRLALASYDSELTNIEAMMLALEDLFASLEVRNTMLVFKLDSMAHRLDIYDSRQNESISTLESVVNSSTSRLELATTHLETSVSKVRSYVSVLQSFSTIVQFAVYGLVIGLIWKLSSMYRHRSPVEDLAFY